MASYVQTNVGLYWGAYNLSSSFNAVGLNLGTQMQDDTVYGDAFVSNDGGLSTVSLEGEGYWDSTTDGILVGDSGISATETLVTVTPVDQAAGSPAIFSNYQQSEYTPFSTGTVGEMLAFRVTGEGRGEKVIHGEITLAPGTTRTSSANSDSNQIGAVSATQSIYSALHVVTVSGSDPTLDVFIKSSASTSGTFATKVTHTRATGVTSEMKSTAGANTNTWWRVYFTIGGTSPQFDFICSLGII